ncbi:MAG: hypothetical protein LKK08_05830 [Bacteroidales bacterium]|nr:hypothetical protein [Bacteroidales bacterium]MCI2145749.1 hypothetical protein [Bacteroidales bacterium]
MRLFRHNRKLSESGFFNGFCDCHCHVLPGVDDGFGKKEDSFAALDYFASIGVADMVLTPHVMAELSNTRGSLEKRFEEFLSSYSGDVGLRLGAEYMLDSGFPAHLKEGLLQIGQGMVLVETSCFYPLNNVAEMLYDVATEGYVPVIAHPERYRYMELCDYESMKDKDCMLQLNLFSLTGAYGRLALKKSRDLLERGMYDLVGTDVHRLDSFVRWAGMLKVDDAGMSALEKLKNADAELFRDPK